MKIMKKSIIDIDGFNLYYGALKGTQWKWLNLEKLFSYIRQDDEILQIKYFTALNNCPVKPEQQKYLDALLTLAKVEIILGKYKNKQIKCRVNNCNYQGNKIFRVSEEKRTDVNIALHMVTDAINEDIERVILVSGDSDLVPAFQMVKEVNSNIEKIVYIPANTAIRGAAVELRGSADKHKTLPNNLLKKSQFPNNIQGPSGQVIIKPENWWFL